MLEINVIFLKKQQNEGICTMSEHTQAVVYGDVQQALCQLIMNSQPPKLGVFHKYIL